MTQASIAQVVRDCVCIHIHETANRKNGGQEHLQEDKLRCEVGPEQSKSSELAM